MFRNIARSAVAHALELFLVPVDSF
jgi:hypothetical protein